MHCVWVHNVYHTCICECINHIYEADGRESSWGELGGKVGFQQAPVGRSSKPAVQNNCCLRQHLEPFSYSNLQYRHLKPWHYWWAYPEVKWWLRKWDVDGRCPLGHYQGGSTYLWNIKTHSFENKSSIHIEWESNIERAHTGILLRERSRSGELYRLRVTRQHYWSSPFPRRGEPQSWLILSRVRWYFFIEWEIFLCLSVKSFLSKWVREEKY